MPTPATRVARSSERIGCEAADARWIWSNVPCHMTLDYRLCHEPAQLARQPEVKHWAKLARTARYRREKRRALIEGPHLLAAALERGHQARRGAGDRGSRSTKPEIAALLAGIKPVQLAKGVFRQHRRRARHRRASPPRSRSPRRAHGRATQCSWRESRTRPTSARSCAARPHSASARWCSTRPARTPGRPKALRAGMGGHFALAHRGRARPCGGELAAFEGTRRLHACRAAATPLQAQACRAGSAGSSAGKGGASAKQLAAQARSAGDHSRWPAGAESLNVAAAAAICLYYRDASLSRPAAGCAELAQDGGGDLLDRLAWSS